MDRCVADFLRERRYTPICTGRLEEALAAITHNHFLFSVIDLDGTEGLDFLRHLKAEGGAAGPIIVLARGSRIPETLGTLSLPAHHVVRKPFVAQDLEDAVNKALGVWSRPPADDTGARLHQELALWRSRKMREVRDIIEHAAGANVTVLITGEAGTGKDLVAIAGAGHPRRVAHRALLDLRDLGWDGEHDAWMDQALTAMDLPDEVVQHLLRDIEVGDDPVSQGTEDADRARGPAQHGLGLLADCQQRVIGLADGHDRGLVEDNALAADVDERVGRAEIDGEVFREQPGQRPQQRAQARRRPRR
jgi:CheY-like chemotaxis protein